MKQSVTVWDDEMTDSGGNKLPLSCLIDVAARKDKRLYQRPTTWTKRNEAGNGTLVEWDDGR